LKENLRGSFGHRTLALSFAFRVRLGKLSGRAAAVHFNAFSAGPPRAGLAREANRADFARSKSV
jgi:hypothetical protein